MHIDTYYYAKEYFQDTDNCKEISDLLSERIKHVFPQKPTITLIGCGTYSGQYLQNTVSTLSAETGNGAGFKINYAIIDNSRHPLSFYYEPPEFYANWVVVLPVTCMFTTAFFIEDFLQKKLLEKKHEGKFFSRKFFSLFLVIDERLKNSLSLSHFLLNKECGLPRDLLQLYNSFGWEAIREGKIEFAPYKGTSGYEGHFLIPLYSKFHLPEECIRCFPDSESDQFEEYSLFPTRINHDTPDLIFGLPEFVNERGVVCFK